VRPAPARLIAAAGALVAPTAEAHLMSSGLGPYYDGLLHLVLTPADLLLVVALALCAGLRGRDSGRAMVFALPLAWLAGGLYGLTFSGELSWPVATALATIGVGLLLAADAPLARAWLVVLAVTVGTMQGLQNGSSIATAAAGLRSMLGIVSACFVIVALLAALASAQHAGWRRVAVRVAGSWVAAIGLLTLGWTLRGGS
jgi:urease accessory protein